MRYFAPLLLVVALEAGTAAPTIFNTTLSEPGQRTAEISTEEMRQILSSGSAVVLDVRPAAEFAVSHLPGAVNVSGKPGQPKALYISDVHEVERLVKDKPRPLVLYCSGPFCGKSKRLADELLAAGFSSVRRYQLGIPVWRALGGVTEIEPEGARYVAARDKSAVFIDAREPQEFKAGSLPGAVNIPRSQVIEGKDVGEVRKAKDDGRLPMEDHNTRVIVFGRDAGQARYVAEALAREAFHNVAYFGGTGDALLRVR